MSLPNWFVAFILYSLRRRSTSRKAHHSFLTLMHVGGTLKFRPESVFDNRSDNLYQICLAATASVNGFWFDDCTFMATVGPWHKSSSFSNTYTGYLDKTTKQLVVETSNYEGLDKNFLIMFEGVYGTMDARLDYFDSCADFCGDLGGCDV